MGLPAMSAHSYVEIMKLADKMKRELCGYCGSETPGATKIWICSNCESPVYAGFIGQVKMNKTHMEALEQVNGFISSGDYAKAVEEYEKLANANGDPALLYRLGLLCFSYSNNEIKQIRYDRKGFMEENARHRSLSHAMYSKGGLLLNRAAVSLEAEFKKNAMTPLIAFTLFMIYIKLDNMRSARRVLELIERRGDEYLSAYGKMVFDSQIGDYSGSVHNANELLKPDNFSINAFYYIALALFMNRKYKEAAELLDSLGKRVRNNSVDALLSEVRKAIGLI